MINLFKRKNHAMLIIYIIYKLNIKIVPTLIVLEFVSTVEILAGEIQKLICLEAP